MIPQTLRFLAAILAATLLPAHAAQFAAQGNAAEGVQREALAREIIEKWSGYVGGSSSADLVAWRESTATLLRGLSVQQLRKASASRTFDGMNALITPPAPAPKSLGQVNSDLVFVPIVPCRIADTRLAGGAIGANSVRAFDLTSVADYSFQGGSASNCGGAGAVGSFAAVALNFTVVSNAAGHITAYPYLATQPVTATLNYNNDDVRGNFAIIALDQSAAPPEMNVYSTSLTHLIIDMLGYFINPEATPLACLTTTMQSISVPAGGTENIGALSCQAGYTETATYCESGSWDMPIAYASSGICSAKNYSASAAYLFASRRCCRVPGR